MLPRLTDQDGRGALAAERRLRAPGPSGPGLARRRLTLVRGAAPPRQLHPTLYEAGFQVSEVSAGKLSDPGELGLRLGQAEADVLLLDRLALEETEPLLRALAGEHPAVHVPVLVLGAQGLEAPDVFRLYELGAADVLVDPVTPALVACKLRALARLKHRIDVARELSVRDELTGLYNRRFFLERLEQEVARSWRTGQTLALLLMDVDRFKRINDTWGHPVGDQVLGRVAEVASKHTRKSDLVARVGGDEFALLLAANSREGARVCAQGLQRRLREAGDDLPAGLVPTVSIGISAYPSPEVLDPLRDLVRVADDALLQAKARGRDRVVLAAG